MEVWTAARLIMVDVVSKILSTCTVGESEAFVYLRSHAELWVTDPKLHLTRGIFCDRSTLSDLARMCKIECYDQAMVLFDTVKWEDTNPFPVSIFERKQDSHESVVEYTKYEHSRCINTYYRKSFILDRWSWCT